MVTTGLLRCSTFGSGCAKTTQRVINTPNIKKPTMRGLFLIYDLRLIDPDHSVYFPNLVATPVVEHPTQDTQAASQVVHLGSGP